MWISETFPADENLDPEFMDEWDIDPDWTITVEISDSGRVNVRGEDGIGSDGSLDIGGMELLIGQAEKFAAWWREGFRQNFLAGLVVKIPAKGGSHVDQ